MSSQFYTHDIADSDLYKQSLDVGCSLHNATHAAYSSRIQQQAAYGLNYDSTHYRGYIDSDREHQFRTDQFDLKYRCPSSNDAQHTYTNDDSLGYACNKGFMYELDEHNTYHNYIVCKNRDDATTMTCCPENIQIFNNLTRRTMEQQPHKPKAVLFVEDEKIPTVTYSKCKLPY